MSPPLRARRPIRRCAKFVGLVGIVWCGLAAAPACAHEVRPAYLQVTEQADGTVEVVWKAPAVGDQRLGVDPIVPPSWTPVAAPVRQVLRDAFVDRWIMRPGTPLDGAELSATNLGTIVVEVLVRVERADGRRQTGLLRAGSPTLTLLRAPPATAVMATYTWLGIEHIWFGFDHLCFVLGLLLLLSGRMRLLQAITAFTVAHSITLALTVVGVLGLASAPVEAVIALSILLLAVEIAHRRDGPAGTESLTVRRPWLVPFVFGLIHGAGFAGALTEVGLPNGDIPLALLCFNAGVEVGQVAFVAVVLGFIAVAQRRRTASPAWLVRAPSYALGSLAAMWCIERVAAIFA